MKNETHPLLLSILKGAGITLFGTIYLSIVGFLMRLILVRFYEPADYGLFSMGIAFISVISVVAILGFQATITRYVPIHMGRGEYGQVKGLLTVSIIITTVVSVLIGAVSYIFSSQISLKFFHSPDFIPVLKVFSVILPFFAFLNVVKVSYLGFKKPEYKLYIESFIEATLRILIIFVVAMAGGTIFHVSIGYLSSLMVASFFGIWLLEAAFPIIKSKIKAVYNLKEWTYFSSTMLFIGAVFTLLTYTDTLMIGYYLEDAHVGIYNSAMALVTFISFFYVAFSAVGTPIIAELYGRKRVVHIRHIYETMRRWTYFTTIPIFMLLFFFSSSILYVLFGKNYAAGGASLSILSLGIFFNIFVGHTEQTLQVFKKNKLLFKYVLFAFTFNIILNMLLIPVYGIKGAAIASLSSNFVLSALSINKLRRMIKIKIVDLTFAKAFLAGLISFLLVVVIKKLFWQYFNIFNMILLFVVYMAFYFILVLLLRSITRQDLELLGEIEKSTKIRLGFIKRILRRFL